jgi:enediyne biosynthesis protein E4
VITCYVRRATCYVLSRATCYVLAVCAVLINVPAPFAAEPPFVEVAAEVGLKFTHVNGATGQYYMPEQMGPGAALIDYDNDGDLDVFLVQGAALDPPGKGGSSDMPTCRLFRNDTAINSAGRRQVRFTDVTGESGLALHTYGMGVAVADYDGDGYMDLFVTSFGRDKLYRNSGKGIFTDVTDVAGVSDDLWSTSAAFVDYDRDGHLDLFVANYLDFTVTGNKACQDSVGARDYCSPRNYRPVPDRLYRNLGNGKFANVTESAGISKADGAGLGVAIGDYNADGWLDVYVANDANANQLWINRHDGTFSDEGMLSGSAVNAAGNPEGSMGIASGDFDQDGDEDIFITNIIGETFAFYENDGRGNFEDVRNKVGLAAPTAAFTGFGTDWFDYDNDGWLDLFVANGAVNIIEAQRGQPTPFRMKNQLFRNSGKGRFEETSAVAGPAFARAEISRAAAFGDVDNDGDVDILVTNNGGPVRLLINQSRGEGAGQKPDAHFLQIRLEQPGTNRSAFGAWVGVERAGRPTLWRRVKTDGSYLAANDPRLHFGLGATTAIDAVVVQWPDGKSERWKGLVADRLLTLKRGSGRQ